MNALLSDNPTTIAPELKKLIEADGRSELKEKAREGENYYEGKHDILDNRIFYVDDNGKLKEDLFASNIKIPHQFLTELVDQKVQYILGAAVKIECEDENYWALLTEYFDEDFHAFLKEMAEGASVKAYEFAKARTTEDDKLTFEVADMLHTIPIYDDANKLRRVVYWREESIMRDNQTVRVRYAEVWDDKQVWHFKAEDEGEFVPNTEIEPNPHPHIIARAGEIVAGRTYGQLPFFKMKNNRNQTTDLEPIKGLIDDYDIMNCYMSNNLQDFQEAIYVVKGFHDDNLKQLRQNVKAKKVVGTSPDGGLDIKTVEIPVEGRKTKMELDRQNIYKFGGGFDSIQVGDGNITNIVIKSRYTLLDIKARKTITYLQRLLRWCAKLITDDINRRKNTAYDHHAVTFVLEPTTLVNESDDALIELNKAQAKEATIRTLMAVAPRLDEETVLRQICEVFNLDWEEVAERIEKAPYIKPLTPVVEDDTTE